MAETTVIISPVDGNDLDKFRIAGMLQFSTATLPGLLQAYAVAEQVLPYLCPRPNMVLDALEDPARRDRAIFLLQCGSKALKCIECLEEGDQDALDYLRTLLYGLTRTLYKEAERA
ncbi:hypothetical protein LJB81_04665 [Desulfovibrio sp. OttesenSCG-928-M14]|nr:hypothetical protein [Desulfovibrio sp. OttesenSCG-928-M14]